MEPWVGFNPWRIDVQCWILPPPPKKNPFKTVVNMNLTDWLHVIHFWNWNAIMMLITIIKSCLRLRNYIFSTLDSLLYMHIDISLMPSLSNWSPVFSREGGLRDILCLPVRWQHTPETGIYTPTLACNTVLDNYATAKVDFLHLSTV